MNRIDYEIRLLLEMARSGALPGYPEYDNEKSFYTAAPTIDLAEYFSGENDALERQLKALWANDSELQKCIPLIIAAVEKNRMQKSSEVPHTELYNYTI